MRYWYDTEFLEDGETIAPISIGIVAADDRTYYAINQHAPWDRIADREWLVDNVVPHLPQLDVVSRLDATATTNAGWAARRLGVNLADLAVKPLHIIAAEVRDFLLATTEPVELWGYYSSYDHILLSQLWGRMIDRPAGIPMWTNDIQQVAAGLGLTDHLPTQEHGHHDALADALWTRDAWTFLRDAADRQLGWQTASVLTSQAGA